MAEAQWALDQHTVESFKAVYGGDEAVYRELRQLGYQPTWYRIPEVAAEIYVTLSASGKERLALGGGPPTPQVTGPENTSQARPGADPALRHSTRCQLQQHL